MMQASVLWSNEPNMRPLSPGKERDAESGNDYFGARYFASTMGRFLSPDWAAKAEPVPYAKLDNPQSLNLYAYVLNNPLGHVDVDGHAGLGEPCGGGYGPCPSSGININWSDKFRPLCICNGPPTDSNGKPLPPPNPVPGGAPGTNWKWNPNPQNSRGGTWGPDKWDGKTQGSPPSASWDDQSGKGGVDHWDVDIGTRTRERWDVNGNSLTPGQAHGTQPIPFSTQLGADLIFGAAIGYTRLTEGLQNLGDDLRNISPPSFPNSPGTGGMLPPMPIPPSPVWFLIP